MESSFRETMLFKFYITIFFVLVFFCVIFYRVFSIQYIHGKKYREKAEKTTVKNIIVPAGRGNVYADDGSLLATSMSKFDIRMDVMAVKTKVFEKNIEALAEELAKLLGNTKRYYELKLRRARNANNRYLLIAKNIDYIDYVKMRSFPIFKKGVYGGGFIAEQDTVRVYPIGKIAQRTIGYDDNRGKVGVEGAFSNYLIGVDGSRLKQRIASNQWKPIGNSNEVEPIDGKDVITTIDVNIQDVTHYALLKQLKKFNADHGCAVVMEVNTGEIKAMSNLGKGKDGLYYERRNYAVWEKHDPGSTFKLATVMAGLEDRVIDTSSVVNTGNGVYVYNKRRIVDSNREHGKMSIAKGFELSSNIVMAKMALQHYANNPKKFTDRIKFFGLGAKTNISIAGESQPYIPDPKSNRWSPISLAWMAWGYGSELTPLQMLTFYNAVANNGELVKPRLVKELRFGSEVIKRFDKVVVRPRIARQSTIDKVVKLMENVVKRGTAKKLYSPKFSMAGKTGTAKKFIPRHQGSDGRMVSGHYSDKKYIASFAGFFPVKNPKYSCIVVIHSPDKDKGYFGAKVAGPVFKEIAHRIYMATPVQETKVDYVLESKGLEKNYQKYYEKLQKYKTIMPNVVGMSGMDAVSLLENMGVKVEFKGVGKVKEQSVKKGEKIRKGAVVYLRLS